MPLDVLVPDLLLPADAPRDLRALRLPFLERWLARADIQIAAPRSADAWLAERFGLKHPAPIAAVALAGEGEPREGTWLRADPVHFRLDRDSATLHHTAVLDVRRDEADALVAALQAHFAPDHLEFVAPSPERWYVRVPEIEKPATTPLAEALGQDVLQRLPRGGGKLNWRAAFTEAQMLLGAHPVNAAREERGEPAINAVWFWGEGAAPATLEQRYARIYSNDRFARGLGTLSGASLVRPRALPDIEGAHAAVLATFHDLERPWRRGDAQAWTAAAQSLERDLFGALGEALKRFGEMRLVLPSAGGTHVASLTPASRWRWFRRRVPLHA